MINESHKFYICGIRFISFTTDRGPANLMLCIKVFL